MIRRRRLRKSSTTLLRNYVTATDSVSYSRSNTYRYGQTRIWPDNSAANRRYSCVVACKSLERASITSAFMPPMRVGMLRIFATTPRQDPTHDKQRESSTTIEKQLQLQYCWHSQVGCVRYCNITSSNLFTIQKNMHSS